jgi:hypothetical protein
VAARPAAATASAAHRGKESALPPASASAVNAPQGNPTTLPPASAARVAPRSAAAPAFLTAHRGKRGKASTLPPASASPWHARAVQKLARWSRRRPAARTVSASASGRQKVGMPASHLAACAVTRRSRRAPAALNAQRVLPARLLVVVRMDQYVTRSVVPRAPSPDPSTRIPGYPFRGGVSAEQRSKHNPLPV